MEWSVTQLGLSEFCETLTGGFSSKTPMSGTLKGVELPGGWNSQGGGTPRGVELTGRTRPSATILGPTATPLGPSATRVLVELLKGSAGGLFFLFFCNIL